MNMELTKEQGLIQKSATDFAKTVLSPVAYDDDRNAAFPKEAVKKMGQQGFLGATVPKEYGGTAGDVVTEALIVEAFAKESGAAAAIAIAHMALTVDVIAEYGSQSQKETYLPKLATGDFLGGFGYSEPGAAPASGSDKVVAAKDGSAYILNGKKSFVLNGGEADVYVVSAQYDQEAGEKGCALFLVEATEVKLVAPVDKLGLRAFPTAEMEFKNAKAQIIGTEEKGADSIRKVLAKADILNGVMAAGIGQYLLDLSVNHAKTRVQFGAPIAKLLAVQGLLTDIAVNTKLIKDVAYKAVCCANEKGDFVLEAAYLKLFAMKAGVDAAMAAVQVHGGVGYSREATIERGFRDMQGAFYNENASHFPQKVIAADLLR